MIKVAIILIRVEYDLNLGLCLWHGLDLSLRLWYDLNLGLCEDVKAITFKISLGFSYVECYCYLQHSKFFIMLWEINDVVSFLNNYLTFV